MSAETTGARSGRASLGPIFLTVFIDVLALTLVLPLLPYYAESFGASALTVGLLLASFSACQLVSGPLLGRLSDRVGRKPVLVVSQLGTCVGLLVMAFSPSIEWLFVGRVIDGLTAGNLSTAQAYITDETTPEQRTRAYGFFGIAFGVGFLVGPAISGALAKAYGFHAPPLGAAGLSLVSVFATATLLKSRPAPQRGGRTFFGGLAHMVGQPVPRTRILELFAYVLSFSMVTGGLALFLQRRLDFDVDEVGYAFAFSGLVGALVQGGLGRAAKRLGEHRLSAAGVLLMVLGYALLGPATGVTAVALGLAIGSVGSAVVRPSLTTLLTGAVADEERGLALGVSQSGSSLAQALGPALAGWVIHQGWLGAWAALAAAFAASVLVIRWLSPSPSV